MLSSYPKRMEKKNNPYNSQKSKFGRKTDEPFSKSENWNQNVAVGSMI